jgi:hypothetical protein
VDGTPINTPETAAASAEQYGEIRHPTIEDIAEMICKFWKKTLERDPTAQWSSLRIWKMDMKGAYTLLCFPPDQAGLFAMLLTDDLQIAVIFGWAGTPAAFQVVTREITWESRHCLWSDITMYVDDIIGVDCNVRGLGQLAASGLTGAYQPSIEDLQRLLPADRTRK